MKHIVDNRLLTSTVNVALVGCGGVGSQVLTGLARLHTALISLGHPGGLEVTAYDMDTVSESNVGRQLFSPADVGQFKSTLLVHRLNSFFGLKWSAKPCRFPDVNQRYSYQSAPQIIISCVDTKAARREIANYCRHNSVRYWMDCGNNLSDGQVILGQPGYGQRRKKCDDRLILPTVVDLYKEIMDATIPEADDGPSCSLAEALERQDLFIGQSIATFGLQLLWSLFRNGGLDHHGFFVNLKAGRVAPLPIDPEAWKRFAPKKKRPSRKKRVTP